MRSQTPKLNRLWKIERKEKTKWKAKRCGLLEGVSLNGNLLKTVVIFLRVLLHLSSFSISISIPAYLLIVASSTKKERKKNKLNFFFSQISFFKVLCKTAWKKNKRKKNRDRFVIKKVTKLLILLEHWESFSWKMCFEMQQQQWRATKSAMQHCCAKRSDSREEDKCKTRIETRKWKILQKAKTTMMMTTVVKWYDFLFYFAILNRDKNILWCFLKLETKRNDRKAVLVTWNIHIITIIKADLFGLRVVLPQMFIYLSLRLCLCL